MKIKHVYVRLDYDTEDVIELEPRQDREIGKWRNRFGWFFLTMAMSAFYKVKGWSLSVNGSIKRINEENKERGE